MKKTCFLFISIILIYMFIGNVVAEKNLIPEDAIRIRVIPNSNSAYDQDMKIKVKEELQKDMYNLLKDVEGIDAARSVINSNLNAIDDNIDKLFKKEHYNQTYQINFGLNYFPEKEYKGVKYEEGYYESLLVTIGEGKGDNWWCVLFPPLCLIEAEESTDVEYTSFVKEMINKYM